MEGRPQIVVYQQKCIQMNVAPYSVWMVDHNSWSTYKEIGRTIHVETHVICAGRYRPLFLIKQYIDDWFIIFMLHITIKHCVYIYFLLHQNMSDDLANDWGCDLICMGHLSGRKQKVGVMIAILANDRRQRNFHSLIEKTTNNLFGLMKLTTTGSDANLYTVTSPTQGNTSGCLVACGSYVSGDSGPLQSWSTSLRDLKWTIRHHLS